jgi:hypothetical protein
MKNKPWLKATTEGRLYIDTSHPEWVKWFISEIERLSKYKIVNGNLVNSERLENKSL